MEEAAEGGVFTKNSHTTDELYNSHRTEYRVSHPSKCSVFVVAMVGAVGNGSHEPPDDSIPALSISMASAPTYDESQCSLTASHPASPTDSSSALFATHKRQFSDKRNEVDVECKKA